MALTPELRTTIQQNAFNLRTIRRAGLSHYNYFDDYSSLIANTEKNLPALVQAGFDESQLPYYRGCMEMLATTLGDRTGVDPEFDTKSQRYLTISTINKDYKAELTVVCRSIAKNSDNRKIQQKFKQIMKGSGDIDDAIDILGLVAIVKQYPELAARIRPAGKVIDDTYCTAATASAMELLQLKGYVVTNGRVQSNSSDFINRIITLCMENQATIKEFAQAAFCKNLDYYNANFASKYRKTGTPDDPDDFIDEPKNGVVDAIAITDDKTLETANAK
jgi:hypothetical protein